ncbi:MAG: hypothetical protein IV105_06855 [Rhizobacter sp.]|nr:hypothetical protein [Rhizobacter sp.]
MNDSYQLSFRSLLDPNCTYAFPCSAAGQVDMDALSERARVRYLYARTVIGREFTAPCVQPVSVH